MLVINGVLKSINLDDIIDEKLVIGSDVHTIDCDLPYGSVVKEVVLNDSVKVITRSEMFADNEYLEKFTIGKGLEVLPNGMLRNSIALKEIIMPYTVSKIGDYAVADCPKLKRFEAPYNLESLGKGAFENDTGLLWVNLNYGLHNILENCFKNCTEIKILKITSNGRLQDKFGKEEWLHIGDNAFSGCDFQYAVYEKDGAQTLLGTKTLTRNQISYNIDEVIDMRKMVEVFQGYSPISQKQNSSTANQYHDLIEYMHKNKIVLNYELIQLLIEKGELYSFVGFERNKTKKISTKKIFNMTVNTKQPSEIMEK